LNKNLYKVIGFLVALSIVVIFLGYRFGTEEAITPCSPGGYPGSCYNVNQKACEKVWESAAKVCDAFVKKASLPPGRLIGPIMTECQSAVLDSAFAGARKGTPECQQMSDDLKAWAARNDFK
jgi:hypothetical protein